MTVTGVSMDVVEVQRAFSDKFGLPFDLLCDTRGEVCDAFRVPRPFQKPKRETFLFRRGKLVWHDASASTKGQARDILRAIRRVERDAASP